MDTVLQALLSWQFIFFCLACAAVTFVARKVVEFILDNPNIPASKSSKFWRDLFLPIFPIVFGSFGAWLFSGFPYPEGLGLSGARFIFGLVAGFLSGFVYRVVRALISAKVSAPTEDEAQVIREYINKD